MSTIKNEMASSYIDTIYGSNVFNDAVMKARLPKATYKALKSSVDQGLELSLEIAEVVANAMKDWAVEKGCTHYTHWFQPMTGVTAEKHDSFISPTEEGLVILEFSGKELIKGEPDASSFPNGGLRATFEARGYTAWDCTSPAFIKGKTLCIPTVFTSYTGEVLDKKTPLLRSMELLSKQAIRVLRALGNDTSKKVITTVGAEQEYFLIDKKYLAQRKDLVYSGRALFGAPAPKGQELDDHYFGAIKDRVLEYMNEVNEELWKLGISAKTQHNEVAPGQFEIAPIFSTTNIATDQNQLIMETLKKVANKHDLVCLLHEKPFAGVNGSGKHNNWSIATDDGINLLDPGKTPHENEQFLVFLFAVIKAVDEYADLLRAAAATPGNDHRLGANEAPPAIISIFLGEQLTDIFEQIKKGGASSSKSGKAFTAGVSTLPSFVMDSTDRNRTSPFAFTGNKFEFRMVGSTASISGPNFSLNTIVAKILDGIATRLENATDVDKEVSDILAEIAKENEKIIFNGDNYSEDWVVEAEKRGLPNIKSMVEALEVLLTDKNTSVFADYGILSKTELHSRVEILAEAYSKIINIEALTTLDMAKTQILPSVINFATEVAASINEIKATGLDIEISAQTELLSEVSSLAAELKSNINNLQEAIASAAEMEEGLEQASIYRDSVFVKMGLVREVADKLETLVDKNYWPMPTYGDMLFDL